ncbi:MAG: hypothetical protein JSV52_10215 [Candidatus Zixiibacteriota bacterium]|nr:MAG: hypothetical protein JSV52_10215 [candidate division Zixibacteria bacterium]
MGKSEQASDPISMLDSLINKYYAKLYEDETFVPKIGEFIKMIEAKRKYAPVDGDQKEFWNMLEEIRKKKMGKKRAPSRSKKKAVKG